MQARVGTQARVRLALTAVMTSAIMALGALPGPVVAAAAADPAVCADVLLLGARGSGQQGPGNPDWRGTPEDPYGLGSTVEDIRLSLLSGLAGARTVDVASVEYPADPVSALPFSADEYFLGLGEGVDWADQTLRQRAVQCPHQHIVLAGYSQGAMVMHRLLERYAVVASAAGILRRIDTAVLVGDGDRRRREGSESYGGYDDNRHGIGHAFPTQSGSTKKAPRYPEGLSVNIKQVCRAVDPVCTAPRNSRVVAEWTAHLRYTGSPELAAAARSAVRDVLAVPLPTPRNVYLQPTVGSVFEHQLTASIDSAYRLEWALASAAQLPPGLVLSSEGMISGAVDAAASGQTTVQVRGSVLGHFTDWETATLHWSSPPPPVGDPLTLAGFTGATSWTWTEPTWGTYAINLSFTTQGGAVLTDDSDFYTVVPADGSTYIYSLYNFECRSADSYNSVTLGGGGLITSEVLVSDVNGRRTYAFELEGHQAGNGVAGSTCRLTELRLVDKAGNVWDDPAAVAQLPSWVVSGSVLPD
jgi:hypothetical protein